VYEILGLSETFKMNDVSNNCFDDDEDEDYWQETFGGDSFLRVKEILSKG